MEKVNEIKNEKTLSVFQASAIVTGYGIGGGILTMPYLANKVGFWMAMIILVLSFVGCYFLHMMIADLTIKAGKKAQLLDIFSKYILRGKAKNVLTIICFVILAVVLYTNLAAYINGAAEIISEELTMIPLPVAKLIFYVIAAIVALFGLKILGISEGTAIIFILAVVFSLCIGSAFNIKNAINMNLGGFRDILAFFGMAMFAFSAFFSIPQVVDGLEQDTKAIKLSINIGMAINMLIMVLVIVFATLSSEEITETGIIGWSNGIGIWARFLGCVFTILAMLTTYWSISFALRDILHNMLKINIKLCWLIATLPSLGIALLPIGNFLSYLELAAGAIAILIALFVIPSFHIARKEAGGENVFGKFGGLPLEILVGVAFILMAVGNLI